MGIENLEYENELWLPIEEFPNYEVSNYGEIANASTDIIMQPSLTMQGALKVGLVKNSRQYTRSVKVIVAETFVKGENEIFDTPVLLNNNQLDCRASNIVWRPRWFAWQYTRQFSNILEVYKTGPILEISEDGLIVQAYSDTVEAAIFNGLLFSGVWESINTRKPTFPNRQIFCFADKV